VRTAIATVRPRKFWTSLRPDHPSSPRRLLWYWAIANGLTIAVAGLWYWAERVAMRPTRSQSLLFWQESGFQTQLHGWDFGASTSAYYVRLTLAGITFHFTGLSELLRWIVGLLLLYDLMLLALLMIFQGSMRLAKVRPIHVVRCLVYSADTVIWIGAAIVLMTFASVAIRLPQGIEHVWADGPLLAGAYFLYAALSLPILYWGVTSWRMYVAYKRYLQFRHALSTTLIVQFMLLLLGTTIFAVWFSFRT
jgi:hypothetical protein